MFDFVFRLHSGICSLPDGREQHRAREALTMSQGSAIKKQGSLVLQFHRVAHGDKILFIMLIL